MEISVKSINRLSESDFFSIVDEFGYSSAVTQDGDEVVIGMVMNNEAESDFKAMIVELVRYGFVVKRIDLHDEFSKYPI